MTTNYIPLVSYIYEITAILDMQFYNPFKPSAFVMVDFNKKNNVKLIMLEDTARYAGLLLASAEGFGLRPRLFLPFGQKKSFSRCLC